MRVLVLKVFVPFTRGKIDQEAVASNVAAALDSWRYDGRITPDDEAHAGIVPDREIEVESDGIVELGE